MKTAMRIASGLPPRDLLAGLAPPAGRAPMRPEAFRRAGLKTVERGALNEIGEEV